MSSRFRSCALAAAFVVLTLHAASASALQFDSSLHQPTTSVSAAPVQDDAPRTAPAARPEAGRETVIQFLRGALGDPYRRGATGDGGFDCSGLVLRAYEAAGLKLPRVTFEQIRAGARISMSSIRVGDLLFYRLSHGKPNQLHVAIYIGDGRAIHASVGHGEVREIDVRRATWSKHFVTAVSLL